MAKSKITELFSSIATGIEKEKEIRGLLGSGTQINDPFTVPGKPGYVWVRIFRGGSQTLAAALNEGVGLIPNLAIKLELNENSEYVILGADSATVVQQMGNVPGAFVAPHTHDLTHGNADFVETLRITEGLMRISSGLLIEILPINNWNWNGTTTFFEGLTYDLIDNVPITANMQRWVKIGIDITTKEIEVVNGDDVSLVTPLTISDLSLIAFSSNNVMPVAGIKLRYGQTSILKITDIADIRPWLSGSSGASPDDLSSASYITKTPSSVLSDEFALSTLATGLLKNTTTTGVPTIAIAGTDYLSPSGVETIANKLINNTNTVTLLDSLFTLQDNLDTTKQLAFQLSSISTGQLRTLTVQDASGIIALTNSTGQGYVMTAPITVADSSITSTTEQLRLRYDSSNYASFTVDSTGNLTIDLTASSGTPAIKPVSPIQLIINETITGGALSAFPTPVSIEFNPTAVSSSAAQNVTYNPNAAWTGQNLRVLNFVGQVSGTISSGANFFLGLVADARNALTSGTLNQITAASFVTRNTTASTSSVALGIGSTMVVSGSGNITTGTNFRVVAPTFSSTGVIVTNYGYYCENIGKSGTTTSIGMRMDDQTGSTNNTYIVLGSAAPTGNWAIYATTTYDNAIAGSMMLGATTAPGARLQVNAAASGIGLIVRLGNSGTSNLQEWQNNAGTTILSAVGFDGHIAVGAAPSTLYQIRIGGTITDPATLTSGLRVETTFTHTTTSVVAEAALTFNPVFNSGGFAHAGNIRGLSTTVTSNGTGGSYALSEVGLLSFASTGTASVATLNMLRILAPTNAGGATISNVFGLDIEGITIGTAQNIALRTGAGQVTLLGSNTIASAAGATWNGIELRAATATITGSTNITTATGFNYHSIAQPTLSAASALTVTNAATLYIANAPTGGGAGPATITNAYSLWVDAGASRLDGTLLVQGNTSIRPNGTPALNTATILELIDTSFTNITQNQSAISAEIRATNTSTVSSFTLVGVDMIVSWAGTANFTATMIGQRGVVQVRSTASATLSGAVGFLGRVDQLSSSGGILSNAYAIYADTPTATGTITNAYGLYIADQSGGTNKWSVFTNIGKVSLLGSETIASAASAVWNGIEFRAATATITGSTNITTSTGFNYHSIARPTLSAANALTITNAATVYIANSPLAGGAGPATITNPYALWIDDGVTRLDGNTEIRTLTQNRITYAGANGLLSDSANLTYDGSSVSIFTKLDINSNGIIAKYNNIATEGYGVPAIVDVVQLTGQTADITTTNCTNANAAGLYRVSAYLQDTTADVLAGVVSLTFTWTDDIGSTTQTITQTLAATGRSSIVFFVRLASGNLTYETTHIGIFGTSAYAVHFDVERIV